MSINIRESHKMILILKTGETVIQKDCRPLSNHITEKGFTIKKCFECRKRCPRSLGFNNKSFND